MKKLIFVIVLMISIFSFDKVYAIDVDNIRDYQVNIVFDKENGELRIHESFSTGNYNEDKLLKYTKQFEYQASHIETDVLDFKMNGSTARFVLKANSKYFIDYITKCSPTSCLYDYHFIKDGGLYSYGNDIKITITSLNEDALPEYTVTKAYDFYLTREKNKIEAYSEKESHSKAFSVKFTPDLERLDSEADSIFVLFICGSIALSVIVSFILIILCERLNKKISNLEDNGNMSILIRWVKNKIGEVDEKALIKSVTSLLVMSILLSILFYIVIKRISFTVAPNTEGVAIYFVIFIIINIFIYLFPIIKYMKYCELKLDYDIKRGEIIRCYTFSVNTNQNDSLIKYKINASITIDGKIKKLSSGYRKVDKLDPIENVFVLYIDDKHYYVDYLKK